MRRAGLTLALLLAGCDPPAARAPASDARSAGASLERAAIAAGLVADPGTIEPTGTFGSDTDSICLLPMRDGAYRIGASVDYDAEQRCVARGTARGRDRLAVDFGGACRFTATLDGQRLAFAGSVPAACDRLCTGRATLEALIGDRLGSTTAEAARARGADGKLLCAG